MAIALLPIGWLLWRFAQGGPVAEMFPAALAATLIFILVIGAVVSAVTGYMAGLVGTSNSPVSGVGILSILVAALIVQRRRPDALTYPLAVAWALVGIAADNLRHYEHPKEKLSHYSKRTVDLEYRFGFTGSEWGELEGIANRTDFDLSTHAEHSGKDLSYFDQQKNERWTPYVIEPSAGLTRSLMAFLVEAYTEDEAPNTKGGVDTRVVLKLDPRLAPVKAAVLPLSRKEELTGPARELAARLRKAWNVDYDDAGAVGRRYRRQDEIGTPFCVTFDFDTLEDDAVTVRERDTMEQERVKLDDLEAYLAARLIGC